MSIRARNRGTARVAHHARGDWRERLRRTKFSPCPTRSSSGACAKTKHRPWRRAVTPTSPTETTPAGLPPIRSVRARADTKSSPRVASAIAYSLLLDRRRARSRRASDPRASARSKKCGPPAHPRWHRGRIPVRLLCHAAKCCTSMATRVQITGSAYAAGCGMSRAADDPLHADGPRQPVAVETVRVRAGWHRSVRGSVRRYTHARLRRGVRGREIRFACPLGRSPHEASSSGQPSVDRLRGHLLTCARCWPLAKRRLVRTSS